MLGLRGEGCVPCLSRRARLPELAAVVGAERFLAEIKTTANLTHPHILPLFDSGEADGFLFYVMPHIEGESLRERIDREKQLGVDDSVDITQKVADALDYAHGNGVVDRDIKPGRASSLRVSPSTAPFGSEGAIHGVTAASSLSPSRGSRARRRRPSGSRG